MNIYFIINSKAGTVCPEELIGFIQSHLDKVAQSSGELYSSEYLIPEDLDDLNSRLKNKLSGAPPDLVVAVGGDGTVMDVIQQIVPHYPGVCLGILPQGTGNLLAINLGIPQALDKSIQVLLQGETKRIDLGKLGDYYFALNAGAGFDADIMASVSRDLKKRIGILAYFWEGIRRLFGARKTTFRLIADDHKRMRVRGISVFISNAGNFLGPFLTLTPEARPDDGILDVCIIGTRKNQDYVPALAQVITRQYNQPFGKIKHFQCRKLRIETSRPLAVQADGNVISQTPVEITIIPHALAVRVPTPGMFGQDQDVMTTGQWMIQTFLESHRSLLSSLNRSLEP